jgi:hypothetical protein
MEILIILCSSIICLIILFISPTPIKITSILVSSIFAILSQMYPYVPLYQLLSYCSGRKGKEGWDGEGMKGGVKIYFLNCLLISYGLESRD